MFGDIFDTVEELLSGQKEGHTQSSWERLPRNCADKLVMPEIPRKQGYPIGLKNQGATCYLNSLFQLLFHTPELRQLLLQLPLCLQNSETPSGLVSQSKHNFLLGLQRLFSQMSLCDQKSVSTEYLNKAFKWQGAQHLEQQDIQEAMRVIFDTIERALVGTQYHQNIRSLFRGSTIRYKTCTVCGETSERVQQFYDLQLQVKNIVSVAQSLKVFTTAESMEGSNAIFCDTCQCNQDMWLGTRLQQLPGTFVLTLNRFDFDYQKMDRVKINDYYEYQLQLDLSPFVLPHPDPDYNQYELYGVVIHRGSAHGGHYLCFARDLMQETDWQKGLTQASAQEARIKEGAKPKDKDKENQVKEYKLTEPNNKKLLENWYEINDNISTAIQANKLTTKYEGNDSAYILFYRRKSLAIHETKTNVPSYFSNPIIQANTIMAKQREIYISEKQHIVLNIEGQDHKFKNTISIHELKNGFIPQSTALVLQSSCNGLPFYPMQIVNQPNHPSAPEDTLLSLQVPHESKWKKYFIQSPQYEQIRNVIGKGRLPLEITLVIEGQTPKRIIAYSDENFLMLRMKIQKSINIPYEMQIITLVTPYKQLILTDTPNNDDMQLPKIGIIHGAQLQIKSLSNEEEGEPSQTNVKKDNDLLICFVIERDDVIGLKRFYFQKSKTLQGLLLYFLSMEGLNDTLKRRFRNLNGNRLYYTQHYQKTLQQLQFSEEMVRLRLERGQIPIKGDISIKIKMQSTLFKSESKQEPPNIEKVFDPNTPISEVKQWACSHYELQATTHKLYLTDWIHEPVRSLTRQNITLFQANFGRQQIICLRDIYSPIGAELVHLQVFSTSTGTPENIMKEGLHVKIEQFKTVGDLKVLLLETLDLKNLPPSHLRLREIKRDHMFGTIWRDNLKTVKTVTINSNKIVYQILDEAENLTDDQIVTVIKLRNRQKRLYEGGVELIFQAGKMPTIEALIDAAKIRVGTQQDIILIKYFHYNFEWVELSRKNIEVVAKTKKKVQQKQKNEKNKNEQGKKKEQNLKAPVDPKQKKGENKPKNKKQGKKEPIKEEQKDTLNQQLQTQTQQTHIQQKTLEQKQAKVKKQKKGGKLQQKQLNQEFLNLRKAPVLLKDGDILGWGLASDLQKDDLQTDQDLAWRVQLKNQPAKYKGKEQGGFKLGVDF